MGSNIHVHRHSNDQNWRMAVTLTSSVILDSLTQFFNFFADRIQPFANFVCCPTSLFDQLASNSASVFKDRSRLGFQFMAGSRRRHFNVIRLL
jgi:hypothetical protein